MTAPYFHDGSVDHLQDAVKIMAQAELGKTLTDAQAGDIVAFLRSLTGQIPEEALKVPVLPGGNRVFRLMECKVSALLFI